MIETVPHKDLLAEDFITGDEEDNPAPSPFHVWDGESWLLPAEHEIAMLSEMKKPNAIGVDERLAEQQEAVKEWEEQNAAR